MLITSLPNLYTLGKLFTPKSVHNRTNLLPNVYTLTPKCVHNKRGNLFYSFRIWGFPQNSPNEVKNNINKEWNEDEIVNNSSKKQT